MSKPKTAPTKASAKPSGSALVALNMRMPGDLISALDAIVERHNKANPFTPMTRTDLVRESLARTISERSQK